MAETLVVKPRSIEINSDSVVDWFIYDLELHLQQQGSVSFCSLVEQLPKPVKHYQVIAIMPADSMLLAHVAVPTKNPRQLRQALPYVAEELLVEDIEHVHMALPPLSSRDGFGLDIAIVAHRILINWLDVFHHNQLPPNAFFNELLCLPWQQGRTTVIVENNQCFVRTGQFSGFICEQPLLEQYLASQEVSQPLTISCDDEQWQHIGSDNVAGTEIGLNTRLAFKEPLAEIQAATAAAEQHQQLNVLQLGYAQGKQQFSLWQNWRWAAYAAAACLLVTIVFELGTGFYLARQANQFEQQAVQLYKRYYPNERRVISPRRQMQSNLASTQQSSEFLALIGQAAPSFQRIKPALSVQRLRFVAEQNVIQAEVNGSSIEQFEQLKRALAQVGVEAKINSATEQGGAVAAKLELWSVQ
jgi:general secretion pathway protein L